MTVRTPLCALLTVLVALSLMSPANAADPSPSPSNINYEDLFYDFELYAGEPQFRWQIVWDLSGGATETSGLFLSEEDAVDFAEGLLEIHLQPEGAVGYEVVEIEVEPKWQHFWTFDKKADAMLFAQMVQNLGFYTDIRRVSIFQSRVVSR